MTEHYDMKWQNLFILDSVFHKVHRRNYLRAINCRVSLNRASAAVLKVLTQHAVKEAGCLVFVLAPFLNNRKSFGEGGWDGEFTTCKHGQFVSKSCSRCQRYNICAEETQLHPSPGSCQDVVHAIKIFSLICPRAAYLWSPLLSRVDFLRKYPRCITDCLSCSFSRLLYTCSSPKELWDMACSVCGDTAHSPPLCVVSTVKSPCLLEPINK